MGRTSKSASDRSLLLKKSEKKVSTRPPPALEEVNNTYYIMKFPRFELDKPARRLVEITETCTRCGGDGVWKGWFKGTCFQCGGAGSTSKDRQIWHFPKDWDDAACQKFDDEREACNEQRRQAKDNARRLELEKKAEECFQLIEAQEDLAEAFHFLFSDFHGEDKIGPGEFRFSSPDRSVTGLQRAHQRAFNLARTASDIFFRFRDRGQLTTKQRALIVNSSREIQEMIASAEAHRDALKKAPALEEGRREIQGQVLRIKVVDNPRFGSTIKVLVEQDDLNKVWGTLPSALDNAVEGDRVKFDAAVEASDNDTHFGFFKRPTKATIITTKKI